MFRKFISAKLTAVAVRLAGWASRITGGQPPPPANSSAPENALPPLLPPEASPDVKAVLLTMPPSFLVKERRVFPIGETGVIPESTEEIKLTTGGKAIAKCDFLTMDDRGVIGQPAQLKGFCRSCKRFSFEGIPCAGCSRFTCPACSEQVATPKGIIALCPQCMRDWQWSKNNWDLPEETPDDKPA